MLIHYLSGSRADFGLMSACLHTINKSKRHNIQIVATGQHMLSKYGSTIDEIRAEKFEIAAEIPVNLSGASGAEMALALATELKGLIHCWEKNRPDMILLLGDRGEMLAGALAAVHLGIHIGHIHGGERSGTLDESFRHAISKLSHFHFPATIESAERLVRMGENSSHIYVIGAPGLVGITSLAGGCDRKTVASQFNLPEDRPIALVIYHPVVQEAEHSAEHIKAILEASTMNGLSQIILRPNSDAGGQAIDKLLDSIDSQPNVRVLAHLPRTDYCKTLAGVDLLIGNTSSGIIESGTFGTPFVNVGNRQNNRQRNLANTFDCSDVNVSAINAAIIHALHSSPEQKNVYGDGTADARLLAALDHISLQPEILLKCNAY